jgi:hypothetical protein
LQRAFDPALGIGIRFTADAQRNIQGLILIIPFTIKWLNDLLLHLPAFHPNAPVVPAAAERLLASICIGGILGIRTEWQAVDRRPLALHLFDHYLWRRVIVPSRAWLCLGQR